MGCQNSKAVEEKARSPNKPTQLTENNSVTAATSGAPKKFTETLMSKNVAHARIRANTDINQYYEFDKQVLGSGFNGDVRKGVHRTTGRRVAVKTLSTVNLNPKRASMLHNEVSIYLSLDHPNIAKLYEVFEDESAVHLVMELCTGKELYERLQNKKKYTERDAAKMIKQMLSAINYCHNMKICHRDLKLENWVFADESEDAQLKLIDFGFSRIFMSGVPMTAMHGTVYYVSPEVLEGCYTEQCDMWSIGVIVYMLLSGAPPFMGATDSEILHKIRYGLYNFNGPRWRDASDNAKDFIALLLSQDPTKRPSAQEALKHAWLNCDDIEGNKTINKEIDVSVLRSMANFAASTHIKRAALGLIAYKLSPQEVVDLEDAFHILDASGNGTISLADLTKVLMKRLNVTETQASVVFRKLRQTGEDQISYSEFLAAVIADRVQVDELMCKEAFEAFAEPLPGKTVSSGLSAATTDPGSASVDGKGKLPFAKIEDMVITVASLKNVLGDEYDGMSTDEIIRSVDKSNRGYLTYQEFRDLVNGNNSNEDLSTAIRRSLSTEHTGIPALTKAISPRLAEGQTDDEDAFAQPKFEREGSNALQLPRGESREQNERREKIMEQAKATQFV